MTQAQSPGTRITNSRDLPRWVDCFLMFSFTSLHIHSWANTMMCTPLWWKTNGIPSSGMKSIFVGFASFFMTEKILRVLGSEGEGHSHFHSRSNSVEGSTSHSSGVEISHGNGDLKVRKVTVEYKREQENEEERSSQNGPSKLSAYLNLFGGFVHNMCVPYFLRRLPLSCGSFERFSTDGLAYVYFTPSF